MGFTYKGKPEKMKRYNLTLHESVVDGVKDILKEYGGKLSPLVENLLIKWSHDFEIKQIGLKNWEKKYHYEEWNKRREQWSKEQRGKSIKDMEKFEDWENRKSKEVEGHTTKKK